MKKITSFLMVLLIALGVGQPLFSQAFKVYHINQNFDNLGAAVLPQVPAAWTGTGTAASCYFSGNGGYNTDNSVLKQSGGGSGNRGNDITFPTPVIDATVNSDVWYVEFDWKANAAMSGPKNAVALVLSGNTGVLNMKLANYWQPNIFGLYLVSNDTLFHYWNQDPLGPIQSDATAAAALTQYKGHMGPAFDNGGGFKRNGVAATHTVDSVKIWNAPTRTSVKFFLTKQYHITAKLNFTTQKVESLTITQNDSLENTQTILDMPFLAKSIIGNDTTVIAKENRNVADISRLSSFATRSSTAGNGSNSNYETYIDNFQVYYMKESAGTTDVTVNYVDGSANVVKTARVDAAQQNLQPYSLLASDKESFIDNGFYYSFDGESIASVSATTNTLTVVFKKFAAVAGPLVWTGSASQIWNESETNFKFDAISNLAYQKGIGVDLSDANAPKDIIVDGMIDLGTSNLTISAPGYVISGNGKITDKIIGTGKIIVNAPVTLGMQNKNNIIVNTTEPVTIKSSIVADSIKLINNGYLKLDQEATFGKVIEGAGEGSVINFEAVANAVNNEYAYKVINASTVNIKLNNAGKLNQATWPGAMKQTYPDNTQVNVINNTPNDTLAAFPAITTDGTPTFLKNVKLNLGSKVRLIRNYNEAGGNTVTFGEISGDAASFIESGFVSGRSQTYAVGNLNTDAVFNGTIRPYFITDTTSVVNGRLILKKVGTGAWTLTGPLTFEGDINVAAGTLGLFGTVGKDLSAGSDTIFTVTVASDAILKTGPVTVNSMTVTVNTSGKLISQGTNFINNLNVSGTLVGAASAFNIGLTNATVNLTARSFEAGDYEILTSGSDITIAGTKLNFTVNKANAGQEIKVLEGTIAYPNGQDGTVFVNGEDITTNTETTEGAKFVYLPETGVLKCLKDVVYTTGINNPNTGKTVVSVNYFNLLGAPVNENAKGVVIKMITYTDNTTSVEKIVNIND